MSMLEHTTDYQIGYSRLYHFLAFLHIPDIAKRLYTTTPFL